MAREWGATAVSFLDDEFLIGRQGKQRAAELAAAIHRRGLDLAWSFECRADDVDEALFTDLREAGLRHVFVGWSRACSGCLTPSRSGPRSTRTAGRSGPSATSGSASPSASSCSTRTRPRTTYGANVAFLRETGIATYKTISNKVLVYRGTALEERLRREGRLVTDSWLSRDFRFTDPRVERAYQLATSCLAPWHELDQERRRLEFLLDTRPAVRPYARGFTRWISRRSTHCATR